MRALLWFFHRLTGVVAFGGLIVHFYVMHYPSGANISYENVTERLSHTGWRIFYLFFLSSIIFHGLYGLWGMAVEHTKSGAPLRVLRGMLTFAYIGAFLVGLYILRGV